MAVAIRAPEALTLSDGSSLTCSRLPGCTDEEWDITKKYLQENPDEARRMEKFTKDASAVRKWQQQTALYEHYQSKISIGDEHTINKVLGLQGHREFAAIFEDVRRGGMGAALQHSNNDPLLAKVSKAVGGIPDEMKEVMAKLSSEPVNLHDACKLGKVQAVSDYLSASGGAGVNDADAKGIMPLGYAVGANRIAVVQKLLQSKADPSSCDSAGNTAVHIAAAYGRADLLKFFLGAGQNVNAKNSQGQTPLAIAIRNKQKEATDILKSKGGSE